MVFVKMTPAEKQIRKSIDNYKWRLKNPNYRAEYYQKNKPYFLNWYQMNKHTAKLRIEKLKYETINIGLVSL